MKAARAISCRVCRPLRSHSSGEPAHSLNAFSIADDNARASTAVMPTAAPSILLDRVRPFPPLSVARVSIRVATVVLLVLKSVATLAAIACSPPTKPPFHHMEGDD